MIVVDASVWVGIAIIPDSFRVVSRAWFAAALRDDESFAGPSLVLAEVVSAVARKTGDVAKADAVLRRIDNTPNLTLLPVDVSLAREAARLAAELGLRGADATYVAVAHRLGCPLVTWDAEMVRKTRGTIAAFQPSPPPSPAWSAPGPASFDR